VIHIAGWLFPELPRRGSPDVIRQKENLVLIFHLSRRRTDPVLREAGSVV